MSLEENNRSEAQDKRAVDTINGSQTTAVTNVPATKNGNPPENIDHDANNKRFADDSLGEGEGMPDTPPGNKRICVEDDVDEMLDLAIKFGFQAGDRLEVEWEITKDDVDNDDDTNNNNNNSADVGNNSGFDGENNPSIIETRWWGATLLEHDGRTKDMVAIRVLDYDPYPDGGFYERSLEDVVFVGPDTLIDPENPDVHMTFRRENVAHEVVALSDDQIEEILNNALLSAQSKQTMWSQLEPAKQAVIAERVAAKKQQLMQLLRDFHIQNPDKIITHTEMLAMFAQLA